MITLAAVDLGNESGRVMRVNYDGKHLSSTEIHRFGTLPVTVHGTLYWDVLRIWQDVQDGLARLPDASGIAVDSFGVDFGLLDARGDLIGNPVHMRDKRTEGMMRWVIERIPREMLFERTGVGFYVINTVYQLAALHCHTPWVLETAQTLLTFPNLINYWMTGEKCSEFTHSTTTQCYNPTTGDWDWETLGTLEIPKHLFPRIVQPGTRIGMYNNVPVYAVASHDTGSAVAAVPFGTKNAAYISSGTWSLMGVELSKPMLSMDAMHANLTNEGGAFGTFRLLKMVMGLWIVQQCRATWSAQGVVSDYETILQHAEILPPLVSLIDPDDASFFAPGDMPARVRAYCERTGQEVPSSVGAILRCVMESLALKYRYTVEQLEAVTGQPIECVHIVGGGVRNALLCQMTADATGRQVLAGPVEATSFGNGLVQLIAMGELRDMAEARQLVRVSAPPRVYDPVDTAAWDEAYGRFKTLVEN
jgi:rhamnulokinase